MRKSYSVLLVVLLLLCQVTQAQRLGDSSFRQMSRIEMADYFAQKNRNQKALGYSLLGGGFILLVAGASVAVDDAFGNTNNKGLATALAITGGGSMIASYPILAGAARNKGKAEMLYMNPGSRESRDMLEIYRRKAKTNTIIAWSLLGAGLIIPPIINSSSNYSETASTVATISSLGIFASIPFFMEAAKNKGRVSILMGTEYVPSSYLNGSGRQTSIGIGFPL